MNKGTFKLRNFYGWHKSDVRCGMSQVGSYRLSIKDQDPESCRLIAIGHTGTHRKKKIPGDQVFCFFSCWCPQGLIFDQIHTNEESSAPGGFDIFISMVSASLCPGLSCPLHPGEIDPNGVGERLRIRRIPVPSRDNIDGFYPKVGRQNNAEPLASIWLMPVGSRTLPDISNDRVLGFLLAEVLHQETAHISGMSLELFCFQDIQDCQPHSTGHWVATKLNQGTAMSDALPSGPQSHGIATIGKAIGPKSSHLGLFFS